ncbi:hypothetical protein CMEL01_02177 [Colletotrichum melonis]|nr:uncharacterized protein CCOS01_13917 [Colletotrichum costaricense]XP_060381399.1 uncharacterized protein CTAM01_07923 [Colletotrichum tamarilloi]KAI3536212.1 hypothetical protein CSPX01_10972 [Colletotrichum filicis]KAK1459178.1 hypothetical protein CMEL01_02177 [Colletotrichum melonis]KAK1497259.1 hypothetical protein CTAM01_07923 [Colletotrichum tamarilloi]KAK1513977.1 hypothetical protein CCOS01_13917 [Colletotrichum costaricense]
MAHWHVSVLAKYRYSNGRQAPAGQKNAHTLNRALTIYLH